MPNIKALGLRVFIEEDKIFQPKTYKPPNILGRGSLVDAKQKILDLGLSGSDNKSFKEFPMKN